VILSGRASAVITLDHGGRVAEPATTKNVTPVPGAGPPTGSSTSPRVAVGPTTPGSGVAVRGGPASSVAGAPLHIPSGMVMTGQIHMRGTRPLAAGGVGSPTAVPTGSPGMPSGGTASASSPGPGTAVATPGAAGTLGSGGGTASAQAGHPALPSNLETTPTIHMRGTRPLAAGGVGSPTAAPTGSPGMPPGSSGGLSPQGPGTAVATPGAAGALGSGGGTATAQAGHPALPSNLETTPTIHMRGTRPLAATSGSPGNVQPAPPASGTSN
jgi:hypothetical protein